MRIWTIFSNLGSPPHTWRIHKEQLNSIDQDRITSTYVENTDIAQRTSELAKDHLHIRGEYTKSS